MLCVGLYSQLESFIQWGIKSGVDSLPMLTGQRLSPLAIRSGWARHRKVQQPMQAVTTMLLVDIPGQDDNRSPHW